MKNEEVIISSIVSKKLNREFKNKVIQSHTCITNPYLTFTDIHFQSHINGPNDNNWNQANYNNFRMTLRNLMDVIEVEFKTVGEL